MTNFDKIARQLIVASKEPLPNRTQQLRRLCPDLTRQIEGDAGRSGPMIFWGECRNVDELADKVIVEPTILESIFQLAGQPFCQDHPHAGLQHTYGYLFSVIDTPYGKKRDRWISTSLETSLGLTTNLLGPAASDGSLLANATWLAGNIAFRGHGRRRWLQRCLRHRVASEMLALKGDKMPRLRETETTKFVTHQNRIVQVSLTTDLVRMPFARVGMDPWLLVYSVDDQRKPHPELITLFTVSDAFVDALRARASLRRLNDIRPRYNAFVQGFPMAPQTGTVRLSER